MSPEPKVLLSYPPPRYFVKRNYRDEQHLLSDKMSNGTTMVTGAEPVSSGFGRFPLDQTADR